MPKTVTGTFRLIKQDLNLSVFKIETEDQGVQGTVYILQSFGQPPDSIILQRRETDDDIQEKG